MFVEVIRPLGGLKYENQANYFFAGFTGHAPTIQAVTYEYVFADWNAARLELTYPDGKLEAIVPGYQRTLGVGPRGNWAHGFQLLPEIFLRRNFVGGTAFYIFAWKPEKESPWSLALSLGANRGSLEAGGETGGRRGGERPGKESEETERLLGVWRTYTSANLFYTFSESLAVGVETDIFASSRLGEYLVLPNFTWRPTQHFFLQAGAGYYQLQSEGQATFMCRANLLFPSSRKPRPGAPDGPLDGSLSRARGGRWGRERWLGRR